MEAFIEQNHKINLSKKLKRSLLVRMIRVLELKPQQPFWNQGVMNSYQNLVIGVLQKHICTILALVFLSTQGTLVFQAEGLNKSLLQIEFMNKIHVQCLMNQAERFKMIKVVTTQTNKKKIHWSTLALS